MVTTGDALLMRGIFHGPPVFDFLLPPSPPGFWNILATVRPSGLPAILILCKMQLKKPRQRQCWPPDRLSFDQYIMAVAVVAAQENPERTNEPAKGVFILLVF